MVRAAWEAKSVGRVMQVVMVGLAAVEMVAAGVAAGARAEEGMAGAEWEAEVMEVEVAAAVVEAAAVTAAAGSVGVG